MHCVCVCLFLHLRMEYEGDPFGVGVPVIEPGPHMYWAHCVLILSDTLGPIDLIFNSQKFLNLITWLTLPSLELLRICKANAELSMEPLLGHWLLSFTLFPSWQPLCHANLEHAEVGEPFMLISLLTVTLETGKASVSNWNSSER